MYLEDAMRDHDEVMEIGPSDNVWIAEELVEDTDITSFGLDTINHNEIVV
jgi:hypothetical protein